MLLTGDGQGGAGGDVADPTIVDGEGRGRVEGGKEVGVGRASEAGGGKVGLDSLELEGGGLGGDEGGGDERESGVEQHFERANVFVVDSE